MLLALLLVPTVAGLVAFLIRTDGLRRVLLFRSALLHTGITLTTWFAPSPPAVGGWLLLDAVGRIFLSITSILFLATALYGVPYLRRERHTTHTDFEEGFLFAAAPEARFTGCLLLFLAAMTLVTESQHFGLLWVAIEATTLASAPLIFFHRHHRSLEATWKYLLICSVGIALALLGNFFLAIAAVQPDGSSLPLVVNNLVQNAAQLHDTWLKAAFLLLLVGYGTKMGLAPLHTWLPDAHSEAPSMVSALLSGALLNCAFLGIIRVQQVCAAAGHAAFGQDLLVGFGLLSMAVAAGFLALTGSPAFGPFLSEFTILKAGLDQGRSGVAIAYLVLLAAIFVGMTTAVLGMAQGTPGKDGSRSAEEESLLTVLSPAVLGVLVLVLGLYVPPLLRQTLQDAARVLG